MRHMFSVVGAVPESQCVLSHVQMWFQNLHRWDRQSKMTMEKGEPTDCVRSREACGISSLLAQPQRNPFSGLDDIILSIVVLRY